MLSAPEQRLWVVCMYLVFPPLQTRLCEWKTVETAPCSVPMHRSARASHAVPCGPVVLPSPLASFFKGCPYSAEHDKKSQDQKEHDKKQLSGAFRPCAPSEAQTQIQVKYYLNSADASAIEAEKTYIHERAKREYSEFVRHVGHRGQV